jgi:type III secretion protein Q
VVRPVRSAPRTEVSRSDHLAARKGALAAVFASARRLDPESGVPLPFDLPALSRGFASLTPHARRLGAEAAAAAARALGQLLDGEVRLEGRALPGPAWPRSPGVRLAIDLPAIPAVATLEVEPALVVRLVDRLAGGEGVSVGATALTPLEQAALELLGLLALEGACSAAGIEDALAPRLARTAAPPDEGALGVELDVSMGSIRGRARLLLPAAAVRALGGEADLSESSIRLPASLRRGTASLLPHELESLEPGDVVLVRDVEGGEAALVLPGGFRAAGLLAPDGFHVEETAMSNRTPQLPVTLEVELCRVELTLAELARLGPGAVLPLALDRRGQVTLRAGDRTVARGELVEVDGAVGVRIEALEVDP